MARNHSQESIWLYRASSCRASLACLKCALAVGVPHKIVPANCVKVTRGIDINRKMAHHVTRAWAEDGTGYVIDYDVEEVHSTQGSDEGLEEALISAIQNLIERSEDEPCTYEDGSVIPISATFMDSRWQNGAIRQAAKKACET